MKIVDLLAAPGVHVSCEVFPPKEFARVEEAREVVREIAALSPAYVSVTYGAAGNTPYFTRELAQTVQNAGVPALVHLTCINDTVPKVDTVLDDLETCGVTNVLALRGDIPEGAVFPGGEHFEHAAELIAHVKRRGGFCVGAACYPEGHPEALNRAQDLDHLKAKVEAGVDFLTTQMFFDNATLYNFMYRALRAGIRVPVGAGIMPVVNARQIRRIAALSGATLPPRFWSIVDRFGDDPASMRQAGVAYATEQMIDLIANGVNNIHLYTMNRADVARDVFRNLGAILAR
ncbi:MAG: methylenetetrahydrofolate reductase [NAD(P)H] [Clostridiales bacterium]|nr:methylenetetrahydrofolate reductase [NAD(P)H] [Clostridiales bacterium]